MNTLTELRNRYLKAVEEKEIGKQAALLGYKQALADALAKGSITKDLSRDLELAFTQALWEI